MKRIFALTLFVIFVSGCAASQPGPPQMRWCGPPGTTSLQFQKDLYECETQVEQVMVPTQSPGSSVYIPPLASGNRQLTLADVYRPPDPAMVAMASDARRRNMMISHCMMARGYNLRPVKFLIPQEQSLRDEQQVRDDPEFDQLLNEEFQKAHQHDLNSAR